MTTRRREVELLEMTFDYSRLKGRITEVCGTRKEYANRVKMSYMTLACKLTNRSQWTQKEIVEACSVLDIPRSEMPDYFFVRTVKNL